MLLTVRCFEPTDYRNARELWQATPGVGLSQADEEPQIRHFLKRNPGLSFVAVEGHALVGTILCGHDGRRGLIHHLVAAPSHRRCGLGRNLLRVGIQALASEGIDKCHLLVFRENVEGLAFWHAVGAKERVELSVFSVPTNGDA
jgi:N-acetylglutamate synthase